MNCTKVSNLLSAYLDRELISEENRLVRLHLMACTECSDELRELEEIKVALGRLSVNNVPPMIPWLRAQLAANMEEPFQAFVWQYPWFRRTCAAAAILMLLGLGSWLLFPRQQSMPGHNNGGHGGPAFSLPGGSWVDLRRIVP